MTVELGTKIQLDQDAVGVGDEDLVDAPAGNRILAEAETMTAQGGAGRLEIAPAEGDVVECRRIVSPVRAIAHFGLRRIDEMHDRHATQVQPIALEGKFRPLAL